eukprot:1134558-Pelagomonas_calceolata.AAC.1
MTKFLLFVQKRAYLNSAPALSSLNSSSSSSSNSSSNRAGEIGSQRQRKMSSKRRPRRAIQSPQEGSGNKRSMGSLCEVWGSPVQYSLGEGDTRCLGPRHLLLQLSCPLSCVTNKCPIPDAWVCFKPELDDGNDTSWVWMANGI